MTANFRLSMFACLLMGALSNGCGGNPESTGTISETRPAGVAPQVPTNLTAADRLLPRMPATMPSDHPPVDGSGAMAATVAVAGAASALAWELPDGWTPGAERPMRLATFTSGTDGVVDCSITELSGSGGGAAANLNRWRGQFGLPPLAAGELEALPTIRLLGQDAPLLELDGAYRGMGAEAQAGSKLLGSLAVANGRTYFVKMVGPAAEIDAQRDAYLALCASLHAE
ncbi:MAG: hypothetical protein O3B24_07535 [Verrucomicrobia bacterium]|nr:hypothetical protein [Verrucomicrobiota bacterium]